MILMILMRMMTVMRVTVTSWRRPRSDDESGSEAPWQQRYGIVLRSDCIGNGHWMVNPCDSA